MWPYVRISSASSMRPLLRRHRTEHLAGVVEEGDVGRRPADVVRRRRPVAGTGRRSRPRRTGCAAASRSSAREPNRSWSSCAGVSTGHIRSSAARTSGTPRSSWRSSPPDTSPLRDDAARAAKNSPSTCRRPVLCRRKRRRGRLDDACRLLDREAQVAGTERHDEVLAQGTLAVADGTIDQRRHPGVALDPAGRRRLGRDRRWRGRSGRWARGRRARPARPRPRRATAARARCSAGTPGWGR